MPRYPRGLRTSFALKLATDVRPPLSAALAAEFPGGSYAAGAVLQQSQ